MKSRELCAPIVLAVSCAVFAQGPSDYDYSSTSTATSSGSDRKFSIFATVGAGFPIGGANGIYQWDFSTTTTDRAQNPDQQLEDDNDRANFGRGLKIDLGASYSVMQNVDVAGAFVLSFGIPSIEATQTELDGADKTTETISMKNTQLGFKILVVPNFRVFDLLDVRVGAGLGLYWTSANYEWDASGPNAGNNFSEKGDVGCKATVPLIGMLGLEYPISDRFIVYLDATYEAMNVTIESIKYEGTSTRQNKTVENFEDDHTDLAPYPKIPSSNIAVRLGVRVPLF